VLGIPGLERQLAVPIRLLLEHDHAFTPEEVKVLVDAFEDTLIALKLVDREDQLTMTVAKLIIQFAKEDERDPVPLARTGVEHSAAPRAALARDLCFATHSRCRSYSDGF